MKNKDNHMEKLLKNALNVEETPNPELVQQLKLQLIQKEKNLKIFSKKPIMCSFKVLITTLIMAVLISTTAFAAWYFLSPSEIATKLESPILAKAFSSDNALMINQTKSQNGYDVTLLGIVSGNGLTDLENNVDATKTYAVVAISNQNEKGTENDDKNIEESPFFISPLIKGQKPWLYNIASMNGGYYTCVVDGIMYRLIECDDLELFADRGLVLIVSSTVFYDINAYNYNDSTGLVTPSPDFKGVNLVFELPLDTSKADPVKSQQYLDRLWNEKDITPEDSISPINNEIITSVDTYIDTEQGITAHQITNPDDFQLWIDQQIKKSQKLINEGNYSEASLKLDRQDYESTLEEIKNGGILTLTEYEDGGYSFTITYPNNDASIKIDGEHNIFNAN